MKKIIIFIFLFISVNGYAQLHKNYSFMAEDPDHVYIPTMDSLEMVCAVKMDSLTRQVKTKEQPLNKYYYKGVLFNGWACKKFTDTSHRYRYSKFENGITVRQIGYYSNGNLDHDFRMKQGKSIGMERMWNEDGSLYVLNYYSAPGIKHGKQQRWYTNKQTAWEAVYDNGTLVYEIAYDREGNVTRQSGEKPVKQTSNLPVPQADQNAAFIN